MLSPSVNDFHLPHEPHGKYRLRVPVHFAILEKKAIRVGLVRHVELNSRETSDSIHGILEIGNP